MRSLTVMVVSLLPLLLLAGACNGDGDGDIPTPTEPPGAPDFEVPVSLTEWAVTADASVDSGEVRFDVSNGGGTVHQLAVYRGGSLAGDAIDGGTLVARTGNIQTGGTGELQASLEPGDYWLVCPVPGHTASGMSARCCG